MDKLARRGDGGAEVIRDRELVTDQVLWFGPMKWSFRICSQIFDFSLP